MSPKISRIIRAKHASMSSKLSLALGAIVTILLVSAILSITEFRRMSTYVSDRMHDNIENINLASSLAQTVDEYNLAILSIVGEADSITVSSLDASPYISKCDTILSLLSEKHLPHLDSLKSSYFAFMAVSSQLDTVIVNDFMNSHDWYFTVLEPYYNRFRVWDGHFNEKIYSALHDNSLSFDEGFYRGIMPGVVSTLVGIILCILLTYFLMSYYVRPIKRMLSALNAYLNFSHPYRIYFDGDDQLQELNSSITDLIDENITLKKRIRNRDN